MKRNLISILLTLLCAFSMAQHSQRNGSTLLYRDIQRLNFLGNAMYVAAHPDDENQRLISYFANHFHARTAYLSMTRGGGGQNLIGPELQDRLGVLRTQELLAARRTDGGEQLFTRARDFGYSKHPDETFAFWDKEKVLADVVHLIRHFKPDVVVNRFDHRSPGSTHGHHTGSAMLSVEAFEKAADPDYRIPSGLGPWQVNQLFFNTSWWFYGGREEFEKADKSNLLAVDLGVYYPDLGLSNNEIAAMARSMHKCQGFGQALQRGSQIEYLEYIKGAGEGMPANLFDGVDTSWSRVEGGRPIGKLLDAILADFNYADPSAHLSDLLKVYRLMEALPEGHWKSQKLPLLKDIILRSAGLYVGVFSSEETGVPGGELKVSMELTLRSPAEVRLKGFTLGPTDIDEPLDMKLDFNQKTEKEWTTRIPQDFPINSHYWLRKEAGTGTYSIEDPRQLNRPENVDDLQALVSLSIDGTSMNLLTPVRYKRVRPDEGESLRRFRVVPPVSAGFSEDLILFPGREGKDAEVRIRAFTDLENGATIRVQTGNAWKVDLLQFETGTLRKGQEIVKKVSIMPMDGPNRSSLRISSEVMGRRYDLDSYEIEYPHIPFQQVFLPQSTALIREDIRLGEGRIGYIEGAGDGVDEGLASLNLDLDPIALSDIQSAGDLSGYTAIVMGIRAYNVKAEELRLKQPLLLEYVKNGGNLIVQYNTALRWGGQFEGIAPYPLQLSRNRVTDETTRVEILDPKHPVLNFPNRILERDFDGWVQERGLYFPEKWDSNFDALLKMADPGSAPLEGGLLHAAYGKGNYFYTSLSFFRQLPAGVPGAYKLFVNLLFAKKNTDE